MHAMFTIIRETLDQDGKVIQCWPLCDETTGLELFVTERDAHAYLTSLPPSFAKTSESEQIVIARLELPDQSFSIETATRN
jgi:hypothetical protein